VDRSTLGSDGFIERHLPEGRGTLREIPRKQRLINCPPLEMVLAREPVSHLIAIAYHEYGYKLKQIADLIRCTLCHGQPPVAASGGGTLR